MKHIGDDELTFTEAIEELTNTTSKEGGRPSVEFLDDHARWSPLHGSMTLTFLIRLRSRNAKVPPR